MKATDRTQSATSLPRAPRDGEAERLRRYLLTMGIRIACFILAVVIQPPGWWTWIFLAGAIFLPYFAVIVANVGMDARETVAVAPARAIEAAPPVAVSDPLPTDDEGMDQKPLIIRLSESPPADAAQPARTASEDER